MIYHFHIHEEGKGFWAECQEIRGIVAQGDSRKALEAAAKEALDLALDEPEYSKMIFPLPNPASKGRNILSVEVEPCIAFALLVNRAIAMRAAKDETAFAHVRKHRVARGFLKKRRHAGIGALETGDSRLHVAGEFGILCGVGGSQTIHQTAQGQCESQKTMV